MDCWVNALYVVVLILFVEGLLGPIAGIVEAWSRGKRNDK